MDTNSLEPLKMSEIEQQPQKPREWRSCCLTMNSSAVKYFTQVIILYILILYSCTMLIVYPDCQSQKNFSALLMIAIGTLIPNPKF
jgi:hypothetical protein